MSFREFDAEKHDQEELGVNKSFIWPEFLKAHGKWRAVSGVVYDACDLFKAQKRHFMPHGKTWAEVKAAAIEMADRALEKPQKLRQVTHSGTVTVALHDAAIQIPVEPDMEADWTLVSAVWQQLSNGYGGTYWRWVWFWEGVQKEPRG